MGWRGCCSARDHHAPRTFSDPGQQSGFPAGMDPEKSGGSLPNPPWQGTPPPLVIKIISGLTGSGGGYMKIPMLIRMFGVPIRIAMGSSAFMVARTATSSLTGYFSTGDLVWLHPFVLGLLVLVGSQIGPMITLRTEPETMRKRLSLFLFAVALLVVASMALVPPRAIA